MTTEGRGDDRRSIGRELRRGSLELIVLHLLAPGEAYGYEIVSKLVAETNGALEVTDGSLYPVLYRLERAGFVSVRWETPERGVPGSTTSSRMPDGGARTAQAGVGDVRQRHVGVARVNAGPAIPGGIR